MSAVDITSQRFGRWLVLRRVGSDNWGRPKWLARCDCGAEREVLGTSLRRGFSKSCGCWNRELAVALGKSRETHGRSRTAEYRAWVAAYQRTHNLRLPAYKDYGGRGIDMAPEWIGPGGFERFYADLGPRPKGYSLDRVDNERGYWPDNCRWATRKEQAANRREPKTRVAA